MFNLKWSIIFGGAAFALSLITSLVLGQTNLLVALLRALCFMVLFFGIGAGSWALFTIFIPDLLSSAGSRQDDVVTNVFSGEPSGSRVNITVDDEAGAALPDMEYGTMDAGEIGQFSDLTGDPTSSPAKTDEDVDETPDTGYTEATEDLAPAFDNIKLNGPGDFSMDFGAFVLDDEPEGNEESDAGDAGSGMGSFSFLSDGGSSGSGVFDDTPASSSKTSSMNKPMKLEGDFDPKEIAAGLRTVLKKDKG
jgi:hypothetical protein